MLHRNISKDWERGWDYSEGMHLGRPWGGQQDDWGNLRDDEGPRVPDLIMSG